SSNNNNNSEENDANNNNIASDSIQRKSPTLLWQHNSQNKERNIESLSKKSVSINNINNNSNNSFINKFYFIYRPHCCHYHLLQLLEKNEKEYIQGIAQYTPSESYKQVSIYINEGPIYINENEAKVSKLSTQTEGGSKTMCPR
ncbi:282_t:CDS:2, partial [Scutellospora calospora]